MTPFEKSLIQAVNDDFSHIPPEEELDCPVISLRKLHRTNILRSCLIAATICALLVGSVLGAYAVRYHIGEVSVETDIRKILPIEVDEEYANNNRYYNLTFSEELLLPNAPDTLETFYLPTYGVSADGLSLPNCCITTEVYGVYRPFANLYYVQTGEEDGSYVTYEDLMPNPSQEDIIQILEAPTCVDYHWVTNDPESFIYFTQYTAKRVAEGTGVNMIFPADSPERSSWETIEIDEYSIFTFNVENTEKPEEQIVRWWYWSNGEYFFSLGAQCPLEEMTALFRSVKAVSTEYPYEALPDGIVENFILPEG